ncbi:MAG TPA: ribonuclease III [Alphaproteobacteria bacterium]
MARAGHRGRNAGRSAADERSAAGDLAELETVLGHSFHDRAVLQVGLRHSSLGGHGADGNRFDRFEFLGDRVIGLVVAELLLNAFPNDGEGDIARRHARLVNRDSLARLARAVELGRYLELSPGEAASGGRENPAVLADAFEAVIAAVYRDGGLEPARRFLSTQFAPLVAEVAIPPRDAKTALQEWAQARGLSLPSYRTLQVSGPAHRPRIVVEVRIDGLEPQSAEGPSRRAAEQAAAAALFARAQVEQ